MQRLFAIVWAMLLFTGFATNFLEGEARRIVSVSLMTDEFLLDLVPQDRILALSRSADDRQISNVVSQARSVSKRVWLDLETIVRLDPDLVVAADWNSNTELDYLRKKGFAVYVVETPRTWAEVKQSLKGLAQKLDADAQAQKLFQKLEKEEKELAQKRFRIAGPRPSILDWSPYGTSMAKGTLWNEIVQMAGFKNAADELEVDRYGFAAVSKETLLRLDPDYLVLTDPVALSTLKNDPVYKNLKAVRDNRILTLSEAVTTTTSHWALHSAFELIDAANPSR